MTMENALKIIIAKSPAAMNDAIKCIQAVRTKSPILQQRYNRCVELALGDPEAEFTPDERGILAEYLESNEGDSRDFTLRVRLTGDERADLSAAAGAEGISLSEYVRKRLFG
jgi:hypothetical protein